MTDVIVERLQELASDDAEQLGLLMANLSDTYTGAPVDVEILMAIIDSPYHEQLVARLKGRIVGAATLSIIMGVGSGQKGYLEDFVTNPDVRGQGIGDLIWHEMLRWCEERGVNLNFTSNPNRTAAHQFYETHGAIVRETTVFRKEV